MGWAHLLDGTHSRQTGPWLLRDLAPLKTYKALAPGRVGMNWPNRRDRGLLFLLTLWIVMFPVIPEPVETRKLDVHPSSTY